MMVLPFLVNVHWLGAALRVQEMDDSCRNDAIPTSLSKDSDMSVLWDADGLCMCFGFCDTATTTWNCAIKLDIVT